MTKPTIKPRIFIGSSVESLDIAYAVQENLEHEAEVTVWSQGIFEPSETTLDALLRALHSFDFALFVFAPDDVLKLRRQRFAAVRDNVVFELGLFIAKLGKTRTFILIPRDQGELRFPTDLIGLTPATFDAKRKDKNLNAALGPACTKIKKAMQKIGPIKKKTSRRAATKRVAGGLSEELREELSRVFTEHGTRIEQIFERFERGLETYMHTQEELETAADPESDVRRRVENNLSPEAQALLRAINTYHLTFDEYQGLLNSPLSYAVTELRDEGFLVPLTGVDIDGTEIPVYWLHPNIWELLVKISEELPEQSSQITQEVQAALQRVKYKRYGESDA